MWAGTARRAIVVRGDDERAMSVLVLRTILLCGATLAFCAASPASAQFFFKSRDLSGTPVTGTEPGIVPPMPGATPAEATAGLVWTLRSALNVAALQCQFAPTLLTVSNYNSLLHDHAAELKQSLDTLSGYFKRINKTKAAGQAAFDHFNEIVSSDFSTVSAQYSFCQTAGSVGQAVLFAPPDGMAAIAHERMRELRNSLVPWGEQYFPGSVSISAITVPRLDDQCWKKEEWNPKKCGPDPFGTAYAAR